MSEATLAHCVARRAVEVPDRQAYLFLSDGDMQSLTWAQLHRRASALAQTLVSRGAAKQPVLLMLPSSLAFVESLFACWYVGAIAVPVSLPRHQRVKHRLDRIIGNAGTKFAMGDDAIRARLNRDPADAATVSGLNWLDEKIDSATDFSPQGKPSDLAVLQYTSGSTGAPRGVMVTHANLMCNSGQIAEACGHDSTKTIGGWLPLYHDMGLVGLIQAAFTGARCAFMTPERFLMQPITWLQMISDYKVCSSPAPNFAYDWCVERVTDEQKKTLDLGCWRNALNGSEPVRAETMNRFTKAFSSCGFRSTAFFPCYGMAEATLFVTGPGAERRAARRQADGTNLPDGSASGHVGCGHSYGDTRIAIVDPTTRSRVVDGSIGEIWITGGSCAQGYLNDTEATADTFQAKLNSTSPDEKSLNWLRTGDLGMMADGELFITGRIKELIIIAGRNLFPVDLEQSAEAADAAVATFGVVAFSTDVEGTERLIIVAEVRREFARPARGSAPKKFDPLATVRRIRAAIAADHQVTAHDVVLVGSGTLPRTSSGKLSRLAAREGYQRLTLEKLELSSNVHGNVAGGIHAVI